MLKLPFDCAQGDIFSMTRKIEMSLQAQRSVARQSHKFDLNLKDYFVTLFLVMTQKKLK